MNSQEELLKHLKDVSDVLRKEELEQAFSQIDRADFVLGDYEPEAYEDYALPMTGGRVMLKPTVVAFMLELLDLEVGERVIDVVSGSGYVPALMAYLVGEEGEVLALERSDELLDFSRENLKKYNLPHLQIKDAKRTRLDDEVFDKMLIPEDVTIVPTRFIDSLREEGLLVTSVGDELKLLRKREGELIEEASVSGFSFDTFVDDEI